MHSFTFLSSHFQAEVYFIIMEFLATVLLPFRCVQQSRSPSCHWKDFLNLFFSQFITLTKNILQALVEVTSFRFTVHDQWVQQDVLPQVVAQPTTVAKFDGQRLITVII